MYPLHISHQKALGGCVVWQFSFSLGKSWIILSLFGCWNSVLILLIAYSYSWAVCWLPELALWSCLSGIFYRQMNYSCMLNIKDCKPKSMHGFSAQMGPIIDSSHGTNTSKRCATLAKRQILLRVDLLNISDIMAFDLHFKTEIFSVYIFRHWCYKVDIFFIYQIHPIFLFFSDSHFSPHESSVESSRSSLDLGCQTSKRSGFNIWFRGLQCGDETG